MKKSGSSLSQELAHAHFPLDRFDNHSLKNDAYHLESAVLQTIEGSSLRPWHIHVKSPKVIGYTFFEKTALNKDDVLRAKDYYDWIVAGSTWCESILKAGGVTNSSTIIQGIDSSVFHSGYSEKQQLADSFAIFSGGKLELRKGQDLVIKAIKVLQDRHDDVVLINSWYNMWDRSIYTLKYSPYITFDMPKGDYFQAMDHLLRTNGIDLKRVVTLPPKPHIQMAKIFQNADCGLFPNRCEGGTNLVLMEFMACGKPAIASMTSGHKDILNQDNCIPIQSLGRITFGNGEESLIDQWDDPNLDEIIEKLEWSYQNRDALKDIGKKAADSMRYLTWKKAAQAFIQLMMD
jgi:glycosyltransferase involved in cell wall biosynthesis